MFVSIVRRVKSSVRTGNYSFSFSTWIIYRCCLSRDGIITISTICIIIPDIAQLCTGWQIYSSPTAVEICFGSGGEVTAAANLLLSTCCHYSLRSLCPQIPVRTIRDYFLMRFDFEFTEADFCRPWQIYSNFLSHGHVTWYMGTPILTMWQKICDNPQKITRA